MTNQEISAETEEYKALYKIEAPAARSCLVDFTKKLIWNNNRQMVVEVVGPTNRVIGHHLIKLSSHPSWSVQSHYYLIVDQFGNDIECRDAVPSSSNFNRVFNPPEEKYDTLMLYRYKCGGKWHVDENFHGGRGFERQYLQRSAAEKFIADQALNTTYEYKLITVYPI